MRGETLGTILGGRRVDSRENSMAERGISNMEGEIFKIKQGGSFEKRVAILISGREHIQRNET